MHHYFFTCIHDFLYIPLSSEERGKDQNMVQCEQNHPGNHSQVKVQSTLVLGESECKGTV